MSFFSARDTFKMISFYSSPLGNMTVAAGGQMSTSRVAQDGTELKLKIEQQYIQFPGKICRVASASVTRMGCPKTDVQISCVDTLDRFIRSKSWEVIVTSRGR